MISLFALPAFGAPFLICDPPPVEQQVTSYEVFQDGASLGTVAAETDGSLRYDMSTITPGAYEFTAKAINVWGVSSLSNPTQSPTAVGQPQNMRLTP